MEDFYASRGSCSITLSAQQPYVLWPFTRSHSPPSRHFTLQPINFPQKQVFARLRWMRDRPMPSCFAQEKTAERYIYLKKNTFNRPWVVNIQYLNQERVHSSFFFRPKADQNALHLRAITNNLSVLCRHFPFIYINELCLPNGPLCLK